MEIKNEIDKLAEMMQREFGAVKNEINKVDNKIDRLESKMDKKFNKVDERFDEVLGREDRILKSLGDLETDNAMSAGTSRRQEDKLENHEERIIVAEEKLGIGEAV